ncbi:MAG: hypothetical protein P8Y53_00810 [Pseudolabrys sp.]|jgi:hypothetical protein
MTEITVDEADDTVFRDDVCDEALEAAAFTTNMAAYTQMGMCTLSFCSG